MGDFDRPATTGREGDNLALDRILGHRMRQRERSQNGSWDDFQNREILEVLLNCAVPRQDMSDLAFRLNNRFGGVMQVLTAPREALLGVRGVTPAVAEWLALTGELAAAYQAVGRRDRIRLLRFAEVKRFLTPRVSWARPPENWVLYTDFEHGLLSRQPLPVRDPWWSQDNMRQMVQDGTSLQASHAILVLFRRPDAPRLSAPERERLTGICQTFEGIQIPLLDCVLVRGAEMYSMNLHARFDFLREAPKSAFLHEEYGREG